MSTAKENILNRIKKALETPVPLPFPENEILAQTYVQPGFDPIQNFATAFEGIQGNYIGCASDESLEDVIHFLIQTQGWKKIYCKEDFLQQKFIKTGYALWQDLESCDVSFTGCDVLIARTGSIVLSAAQAEGRTASVYAPVHVCVAYASQIKNDIAESLAYLKEKYGEALPSFISFASGPSRTADIEKTLVTGVHGPKEVYCIVVNDLN